MNASGQKLTLEKTLGGVGARIDRVIERAAGTVDELRLQMKLGEMDAEEHIHDALKRAEDILSDIRRQLDDVKPGSLVDEEGLKHQIDASLKTLGRELEQAEELR
jgi:signal transduction histidine kinase